METEKWKAVKPTLSKLAPIKVSDAEITMTDIQDKFHKMDNKMAQRGHLMMDNYLNEKLK